VSRFDPTPVPGYDPLLRINLRERPEGGEPLAVVQAGWRGQKQLPQRELLVLIHGYNNHRREAEVAYVGLRKRQEDQLADVAWKAQLEDRLGDAFWPGDADWPGLVDKLDFYFYAKAVSVAKDVAPKIGEYLRTRTDVLTVHFLAHSLGCRVALEVIDDIARNGGPTVGKVCLLAAAVPTFKVCPGGSLFGAIAKADKLRVLFSPADMVLSATFPPGQTITRGDEGFFPTAVGHAGDIPVTPGKVDRDHIPGAGHGDYWGHESGLPTELSAKSIFEFFRFDGIGSRTLSERPLPPSRPEPPSRKVADQA
jgi:hypothetical protein